MNLLAKMLSIAAQGLEQKDPTLNVGVDASVLQFLSYCFDQSDEGRWAQAEVNALFGEGKTYYVETSDGEVE